MYAHNTWAFLYTEDDSTDCKVTNLQKDEQWDFDLYDSFGSEQRQETGRKKKKLKHFQMHRNQNEIELDLLCKRTEPSCLV